ncbi:MAG: signal peptide peptidase SppA [Sumerlaeia bacterium]
MIHSFRKTFTKSLLAAFILAGILSTNPLNAQSNPFSRAEDDPTTKPLMLPVLKLNGMIEERSSPFSFFDESTTSLHDLITILDRAAKDDKIAALAIQVQRPSMGLAQTTELRNALLRFRESDKDLIMLLDVADLRGYYLASAGSEIVLTPVGGLMTYGLSFNLYFFRDMLAKIGLKAQVVNTGDFKNALEPFTNQEMSEGTRTQYTTLMNDLTKHLGNSIGSERGITEDQALKSLFAGPLLAPKAFDEQLITRVEYIDEFLTKYADDHQLELEHDYDPLDKKPQEVPNLFSLFSSTGSTRSKTTKAPKIALIYALGNIIDGEEPEDPFADTSMIASDSFIDLLDEAVQENAKAIVIRVDSGGGSAVASDRIWQKLNTIQNTNKIPVVVSMGNIAASGGYYISMGAERIFVQPTTITGSIGVIAGRIVMGDLYNKIGVNRQSISQGENSWLVDETTEYTPEQIAFIETLIMATYEDFTRKAADSRAMTQEQIKALAGGRVWTGLSAIDNGLADELGGLQDAIAFARTLTEDGGDDLPLVEYPKEKSFSDIINELMSGSLSTGKINPSALAGNSLVQWKSILPENALLHRFLGTLSVLTEEYQVLAVEPLLVEF